MCIDSPFNAGLRRNSTLQVHDEDVGGTPQVRLTAGVHIFAVRAFIGDLLLFHVGIKHRLQRGGGGVFIRGGLK